MSLEVGAIVLCVAMVLAALSWRDLGSQSDVIGILAVVILAFARGPEPLQTYLIVATCTVFAAVIIAHFRSASASVLRAIQVELTCMVLGIASLVISESILPETHPMQPPLVVAFFGFIGAFVLIGVTRVQVTLFRAYRRDRASQ